jgi:hypothetical protein
VYRYPRTSCSYLHRRIAHLVAVVPRLEKHPACAAVLAAELEVRQAHLDEFRAVFPALPSLLISGPHDA